jgi:hypothetical protein
MSQIEDAKTILRILLSFMVIDNEVNIKEKEIIVNFLKTKF